MNTGTVVAAFGRQYEVMIDGIGIILRCTPRAKKSAVACGDRVEIRMTSADQGVIDGILPRNNLLYRADAFNEKLIAANVTQVVVVAATEPSFNDELITRCLCAAEAQEIPALIVLNKCDLFAQRPQACALLAPFAAIGYPIVELSAKTDVTPLRDKLKGHTNLFVGQSGMGKSTLTNALVPEAGAATREISDALNTGKHTTTHARMYPLPGGGMLIDSPGLQAFGLAHLSIEEVETGFREIRALRGTCRFRDCGHEHEPDCAIRAAVATGTFSRRRYQTLLKLLSEHRKAAAKY
ncbi:MAG TPA: ribosome small subunit-dependent GTPase A [Rhodocyclaceae bacterium]|nr:ribosome small subunit-dependent GTPase A [Rhodocyclaceae bacterium]